MKNRKELKKPSPTFCTFLLVLNRSLTEHGRTDLWAAHLKLDRAVEPTSAVLDVMGSHVMVRLKTDKNNAIRPGRRPAHRSDPVGRVRAVHGVSEAKRAAWRDLVGDRLDVEPNLVVDQALEGVQLRVRPHVRARGPQECEERAEFHECRRHAGAERGGRVAYLRG